MDNPLWPDFHEREFFNVGCSLSDMNPAFMDRLQMARRLAGVPFIINSAYRSVEHEKAHKRSGQSMHCLGRAVDIKCVDSGSRHKILNALLQCGFNGIGIDNTFIHCDDRSIPLIWLY